MAAAPDILRRGGNGAPYPGASRPLHGARTLDAGANACARDAHTSATIRAATLPAAAVVHRCVRPLVDHAPVSRADWRRYRLLPDDRPAIAPIGARTRHGRSSGRGHPLSS